RRESPSRTSATIALARSSASAIVTSRSTGASAVFVDRLVIACTPKTAEDLPPNRVVPIAERIANRSRPRCPGAASQHLVLCSKKDLRVLGIRKRRESRIAAEVRARPLPYVAEHPVTA